MERGEGRGKERIEIMQRCRRNLIIWTILLMGWNEDGMRGEGGKKRMCEEERKEGGST